MKSGSNKKKILITAVLMFLLFAAYLPWNMPSLINADKPFIDLSGSIGDSIGNANTAYEKGLVTPVPTDTPGITPEPTPEITPTDIPVIGPEDKEFEIIVGAEDYSGDGESIVIMGAGGAEMKAYSITSFETMINGEAFSGKSFVLVDNYAENQTYRDVMSILDGSGKEYRTESREVTE